MYIQLGNFTFDKAFSPDGITHSDEANYAEHALINLKPRLQHTGNNLEEINFTIRLRAEFVDITQTILNLKTAKDEAEILPFLYGYGVYKGDYVITKIEETKIFTLADGLPVDVALNITLKEYIVPDKLQQQQNAARKNAFAVGAIKPIRNKAIQKFTPPQIAAKNLSAAYSQAAVMDKNIRSYENNTSSRQAIITHVQSAIVTINNSLDAAAETIKNIPLLNDADIINQIERVKGVLGSFNFPVANIKEFNGINSSLQDGIRDLKKASFPLISIITTRNG